MLRTVRLASTHRHVDITAGPLGQSFPQAIGDERLPNLIVIVLGVETCDAVVLRTGLVAAH